MDLYKNYNHLLSDYKLNENFIIECNNKTNVLIFTPHGGGIEPGTTELVKEIASTDMSYYSFTAKRKNDNKLLHITSTNFDEPTCLAMQSIATTSIAIHGSNEKEPLIYIGGQDIQMIRHINEIFQKNDLDKYKAPFLRDILGLSKNNIVNKNAIKAGVQFEFSYGIRKMMFENVDKVKGRINKTPFFWKIVHSIRESLTEQLFDRIGYV